MISLKLSKLVSRKLIKISGPDCYPYLQGLLCNDLRYLYEPDRIPIRKYAHNSPTVISSFMLNAQGRAICDMLIYRTPNTRYQCNFSPPGQATEHDELIIECDSELASGLANTLYGYRVRRKIKINIENDLSTWCLYPDLSSKQVQFHSDSSSLVDMKQFESTEILTNQMTLVSDPRLTQMGMRILSGETVENLIKSLQSLVNVEINQASLKDYTLHRYKLGVGEGIKDHPESDCLPLECNADFLGSVSFNKGCYLGQELTARIHYQGVIRKRLMPIVVHRDIKLDERELVDNPIHQQQEVMPLIKGSDIINYETKKKVGVLRNILKDRGLALLRHDLALNSENLVHVGTKFKITTSKPYWWDAIEH